MRASSRRRFLTSSAAAGAALAIPRIGTADGQSGAGTPVLSLACANYIRFLPIATGDVKPTGLALTWLRGDRTEMLRRATDDPAIDGGETSLKLDLRNYAYDGRVQLVAARLYQGQTTNFRTAGGGFAPVFTETAGTF